jgi:hypothetical protein
LGQRHGRAMERQSRRDALAEEGCRIHERGRWSSSLEARARADSSRELRSAPQDLHLQEQEALSHEGS